VNPELAQLAGNLDELKQRGVTVQRFNLSSEPAAFFEETLVKETLDKEGNGCLPLIMVNGDIVSKDNYPTLSELMQWVGLDVANEMASTGKPKAEEFSECGPGCACETSGSGGLGRYVAGIAILLVAGVLVARAVIKDNGEETANPKTEGFAVLSELAQTPASEPETKSAKVAEELKEIASFSELNSVAMGSAGVFIYVPAKDGAGKSPTMLMQGAARTIEPQLKGKIGLFVLKTGSFDYDQIANQMAVPGVIALVPGGRMVPVTGGITETKLVQGLVGSVQSCGAGGCGPRGCG
jgi:hypothetical protein